jgi:hypothetical protein
MFGSPAAIEALSFSTPQEEIIAKATLGPIPETKRSFLNIVSSSLFVKP